MENIHSNAHDERLFGQLEIKSNRSDTDKGWKKNIVKDLQAPAYFSQPAIWAFSTFFTVIFGVALLCFNLKGNSKGQWMVIGFGSLYAVLTVLALVHVSTNAEFILTINAMGGFILTQLFWDRYIGEETKYRTRSVVLPLIVSAIIIIPVIIFLVYELLNKI